MLELFISPVVLPGFYALFELFISPVVLPGFSALLELVTSPAVLPGLISTLPPQTRAPIGFYNKRPRKNLLLYHPVLQAEHHHPITTIVAAFVAEENINPACSANHLQQGEATDEPYRPRLPSSKDIRHTTRTTTVPMPGGRTGGRGRAEEGGYLNKKL